VLEGLRGDDSIAELCRKEGIAQPGTVQISMEASGRAGGCINLAHAQAPEPALPIASKNLLLAKGRPHTDRPLSGGIGQETGARMAC
jgi:hypothetical protein